MGLRRSKIVIKEVIKEVDKPLPVIEVKRRATGLDIMKGMWAYNQDKVLLKGYLGGKVCKMKTYTDTVLPDFGVYNSFEMYNDGSMFKPDSVYMFTSTEMTGFTDKKFTAFCYTPPTMQPRAMIIFKAGNFSNGAISIPMGTYVNGVEFTTEEYYRYINYAFNWGYNE